MRIINQQSKLSYDGSFEGLLSAVFTAYELKLEVVSIKEKDEQLNLFQNEYIHVDTDQHKADRVLRGVVGRYGKAECKKIYRVYLTEDNQRAYMLYQYFRRLFDKTRDWRTAYQLDEVRYVKNQLKKMRREVHRMHAFVRFQQTKENLYFALIEPDFDVMPFIGDHFKKRYSDQSWLIFDKRRAYGLYYDLSVMRFFSMEDEIPEGTMNTILAERELSYEEWWRSYFSATNIKERKNDKLHLRHVPKRYWKYLTEKL